MVDAWLIVVIVITGIVMLALNIYLFIIYCHPDDLSFGAGWFAKVMFLLGSAVSWGFLLIMPLDIANSRGTGGNLNIQLMYMIFFILFLVFLVVLLPITLFIYESDDEKPIISRFCGAFVLELFFLVIVIVLAFIAYGVLSTAVLCSLYTQVVANLTISEWSIAMNVTPTLLRDAVTYTVPPFLFPVIFLEFLGWFLFFIFGGIGLSALPMDMIIDYFYRPRPRSAKEIAERKVALRRRTEELLLFAKSIEDKNESFKEEADQKGFFSKWRGKRSIRHNEKELNKEVYKLEEEFEIFEIEQNLTANPIWEIIKLIIGFLCACLSITILIHIIINVLVIVNGKPLTPCLNSVFVWLEYSIARFVSTIFFVLFSLYLMGCVIKGNIKFGLRLFFLIKIHPMKQGRTYMNSFIFNGILILFCVPAVIHFQVILLQSYMQLTTSVFLFTTIIQNMKFFKWFYQTKFFIYAFVAWTGVTFLYLLIKPKSDRMDIKKIIERRKKV